MLILAINFSIQFSILNNNNNDVKTLPTVTRKLIPSKINFGAKIFHTIKCRQFIDEASIQKNT